MIKINNKQKEFYSYNFKSVMQSWKDNILGRALVLYSANLGIISGISFGPPYTTRSNF